MRGNGWITGALVAIVTPMREDGTIDYDSYAALLDFQINAGINGIIAVGTTGESATLTHAENSEVVRFAVQHVAGRVPVIAGTGSNATAEAIMMSRDAADAGADACLQVTPYYNRPTQQGMFAHFSAIAEAAPIPHILYNVPSRTASDLSAETTLRLADVDNIVGIKEAADDSVSRVDYWREHGIADNFCLLSGDDATACDFLLAGGDGVISVTANVAPAQMATMCRLALGEKKDAAYAADARLRGLHRNLFIEPNPTPTKWALTQMGLINNGIRLPLLPLTPEHQQTVIDALRDAGVKLP